MCSRRLAATPYKTTVSDHTKHADCSHTNYNHTTLDDSLIYDSIGPTGYKLVTDSSDFGTLSMDSVDVSTQQNTKVFSLCYEKHLRTFPNLR